VEDLRRDFWDGILSGGKFVGVFLVAAAFFVAVGVVGVRHSVRATRAQEETDERASYDAFLRRMLWGWPVAVVAAVAGLVLLLVG